jgi:transcriptional regulator with XRE-family HTH domain
MSPKINTNAMESNHSIHYVFSRAHHLIEANEARRISQAEMAQRLGISVRAYSNYLQGQETTALSALQKLLELLTEQQLFGLLHSYQNSKN